MNDGAPADYLRRLGAAGAGSHSVGPHDIATAALMLAALDHPERELTPYLNHLAELAKAARAEAGFARDVDRAARGLSELLADRFGYDGERVRLDDPENADFILVIERRRGLPVALGILYLHVARAAGLNAWGLAAPGHFLLTIEAGGAEVVIDPFHGGATIDPERLGGPPMFSEPQIVAAQALEPVDDIDVLLRLQNNIRARALNVHDELRAADILERMLLIAPDRSSLWLDLGRLQESFGALGAAREAYERADALAQSGEDAENEAGLALQALKRRLS